MMQANIGRTGDKNLPLSQVCVWGMILSSERSTLIRSYYRCVFMLRSNMRNSKSKNRGTEKNYLEAKLEYKKRVVSIAVSYAVASLETNQRCNSDS